jgi:hypothetical protein
MATAQQLIARAPSLVAFQKPPPESTGGRVGGSTTSHRVSNARRESRIAGESFMFPGAEKPRAWGMPL